MLSVFSPRFYLFRSRRRRWHIAAGAYRRCFTRGDLRQLFGRDFAICYMAEASGEGRGFWHVLLRRRDRAGREECRLGALCLSQTEGRGDLDRGVQRDSMARGPGVQRPGGLPPPPGSACPPGLFPYCQRLACDSAGQAAFLPAARRGTQASRESGVYAWAVGRSPLPLAGVLSLAGDRKTIYSPRAFFACMGLCVLSQKTAPVQRPLPAGQRLILASARIRQERADA